MIQEDKISDEQKRISNLSLSESARQEKLDNVKIDWLKARMDQISRIVWCLIGTLLLSVAAYLVLLFCKPENIPKNFWHIPTLLGLLSSALIVAAMCAIVVFDKQKAADEVDLPLMASNLEKIKNLFK